MQEFMGISKLLLEKKDNYILLEKIHDQKLLAEFYSLADAFVICSSRENFPTTCVEAQCCGTPVTGFDTGGTKETSLVGKSTFCEYGDIKSLVNSVKNLLLIKNLDEIGYKAEKEYSKEVMYRRYENLYENLCSSFDER